MDTLKDLLPIGAGLGLGVGILIGIFLFYICFTSMFLHIGAGIAGVENRFFLRSVAATFASSAAFTIVTLLVGFFEPVSGFILGLFSSILLIKWIYETDFNKAFVAYIMSFVVVIILMLILLAGLAVAGISIGAANSAAIISSESLFLISLKEFFI